MYSVCMRHACLSVLYVYACVFVVVFWTLADSPGSFDEAQKHKEQLLDETEAMLSGEGDWLLSSYSIADVVLTCMLCNLLMFGLLDLKSRPAISKYLDSVKKRPSYKQAHISDTLPWTMRAILIPVLIIQRIKSIFTK